MDLYFIFLKVEPEIQASAFWNQVGSPWILTAPVSLADWEEKVHIVPKHWISPAFSSFSQPNCGSTCSVTDILGVVGVMERLGCRIPNFSCSADVFISCKPLGHGSFSVCLLMGWMPFLGVSVGLLAGEISKHCKALYFFLSRRHLWKVEKCYRGRLPRGLEQKQSPSLPLLSPPPH